MKKYKLVIEYDGTAYLGWQSQLNGATIQEVMEHTLQAIIKMKTNIIASGRTDAGVHAEAQVAHFTTRSKMTGEQFHKALNSALPHDIKIIQVEEVPMGFNARRDALRKIYRYTILNRNYPSALEYKRCWYVPTRLNQARMKRAAQAIIGIHDFRSFQAAKCGSKSTIREIYRIDFEKKKEFLQIVFEGSGFLKHMIRNIVGTLIWIGKGKLKEQDMEGILKLKDRRKAGPTAPPQGLFLVRVIYP